MRIFETPQEITPESFPRGSVIAIGKFDGVHLGHRALLARLHAVAAERGLEAAVFTFANNPLSLLSPERCPQSIMSREQRIEALAAAGVASCVMVEFDEALSSVPAEEFVRDLLVHRMRARMLIVGEDFRFGHRGSGDVSLLQRLGPELGFAVEVIGEVDDIELGRVSSSAIRDAILAGDVVTAERMLGRPVAVRGVVVHGDARGRELGFPTANLGAADGAEIEGLVPADGVYAGWAIVRGERHPAAISVGVNLTFQPDGEPRVEAFLLDFEGDLYGQPIEVRFAQRLRGMVAFEGADALVARISADVEQTRELLLGV